MKSIKKLLALTLACAAAASLAANRGAYQIVCSLSAWASFLRAEGFREEKERFVLQTEQIVKFCKD